MDNTTRNQFNRIISFVLAMVMIFSSVPMELYAETIGAIDETSSLEQDVGYELHEEYEYDYEFEQESDCEENYDYGYDNEYGLVINAHSISGEVVSEEGQALYGASISLGNNEAVLVAVQTDVFGQFFIAPWELDAEALDGWFVMAELEGFGTQKVWLDDIIDEISDEGLSHSVIDFILFDAEFQIDINPLTNIGPEAIWHVSHEIGRSGEYVDVRIELVTTTTRGMGETALLFEFDPLVLSNPRVSPFVLRENLPAAQQITYDILRAANVPQDHINTTFASYAGGNHALKGLEVTSSQLMSGTNNILQAGWTLPRLQSYYGYFDSGLNLAIRFDILPNVTPGVTPVEFRPNASNHLGTFHSFMTGSFPLGHPSGVGGDPQWSVNNGSVTVVVDNITVRVEDPGGYLIPHAELTAARGVTSPVTGMTITPGTGVAEGSFLVNGTTVNDEFTATATPGFEQNTRTLTVTETVDGTTVVITLTPLGDGLTVNVVNSAGTRIPTATLAVNRVGVTPVPGANAGSFTVDGVYINDVFTANAPGFAQHTHPITAGDMARGYINIVLNEYEPVTLTVRVVDESGNLIPNANLSGLPGITGVTGQLGVFNVSATGANEGTTLTASANLFNDNTHDITFEDLRDLNITIELTDGGVQNLRVYVRTAGGVNIPTAALTGVSGITAVEGTLGAFNVPVTRATIDQNLVASAPGFADVTRQIVDADLNAPLVIIITMDVYVLEDVEVRVYRRRADNTYVLLPTATLSGVPAERIVAGAEAGTFSVRLDGRDVGTTLSAIAPGFSANGHEITFEDLEGGPIEIVLQGDQQVTLTVTVTDFNLAQPRPALVTSNLVVPVGATRTGENGVWQVTVTGAQIDSDLIANARGFAEGRHPITAYDLADLEIEIPLRAGEPVPLRVYIVDSEGRPVPTSILSHDTATINSYPIIGQTRSAVFTTTANSDLIGTRFTAIAPGFNAVTYLITADVLARDPGVIIIELGRNSETYPPYSPVNVTVNVVRLVNGVETALPTAMLTFGGATQGPNSTFVLRLYGSNYGDIISAVAPGFAVQEHAINFNDLLTGVITIRMTDYVYINLPVMIADAAINPREALGHSTLASLAGLTVTGSNGTFSVRVSGAQIGSTLRAEATGFGTVNRVITAQDLATMPEGIIILLHEGIPTQLTVRVVNRYDVLIPTARLANEDGIVITSAPVGSGVFTVDVPAGLIGTAVLMADAPGFAPVNRTIIASYLEGSNPTITIRLDQGYRPVENVEVRVYHIVGSEQRLLHTSSLAGLAPAERIVAITSEGVPTGRFNTRLYGSDVGTFLVASAPGFATYNRRIEYADLETRVISIVLRNNGQLVPLTVRVFGEGNLITPLPSATLDFNGDDFRQPGGVFTILANAEMLSFNMTANADGFNTSMIPLTVDHLAAGYVNIILAPGGTVILVVTVLDSQGRPLPTANLTLPLATVARQADGHVFHVMVNANHVESDMTASAPGFINVVRPIELIDLTNRNITIHMNAGYAIENVAVRVYRELMNGTRLLLPTAMLSGIPAERITSHSNGTFTVRLDGGDIGQTLSAEAPGFAPVGHPIIAQDLRDRVITIVLGGEGDDRFRDVVMTVTVQDSRGNRLSYATLTGVPRIVNNNDGTFTVTVDGRNIDDTLTAEAPGFAPAEHVITAENLRDRAIAIVLGGGDDDNRYRDVVLNVTVQNTAGNRIPSATLTGVSRIVRNNDGTFAVTVDGRNIGSILAAAAPGFNNNTHAITDADLYTRDIVITLSGSGGGSGGGPSPGGNWYGTTLRPVRAVVAEEEYDYIIGTHARFIHGFPDGTVRADAAITRAEAAMIIFRLLDDDNKYSSVPSHFSDVSHGSWYSQAITYLAQQGILLGYPDGTFRPNATITRAEFTAVVTRFFGTVQSGQSNFPDVSGSHWAATYISTAVNAGWVLGHEDGTFRPENAITRAEVVVIMNRILDRVPNPETIRSNLGTNTVFTDITSAHWAFYNIMEAAIDHTYKIDQFGREVWIDFTLQQ